MLLEQVPEGAPDVVFGLQGAYLADSRQKKMTLIVGTYKDSHLKSHPFKAVKDAQQKVFQLDTVADYLPIDGMGEFCHQVGGLCFGQKAWSEIEERTYSMQGVGGTGSLRIGAEFLVQEIGREIWVPLPSWANHKPVFERAGLTVHTISYYNTKTHSFDREVFLKGLRALPEKGIVLFHVACHNPTGSDPTLKDWEEISKICKERSLFPYFDFAYQGFGEGIEKDLKVLTLFLKQGHEFMVAYSCSKNFGLYRQRVGALFVVSDSHAIKKRVASQIKRIIRANYSNPPAFGAMIVTEILKNQSLRAEWQNELDLMRERITSMRERLFISLREKSGNSHFDFIQHHKGMFSYLDLSQEQSRKLIEDYAIYTLDNGRINIAGLNEGNIDFFVDSLLKVCVL